MQIEHDTILDILREAAAKHILPLWQNLEDHHISDKGGGDLVTAADQACEQFLTNTLAKVIHNSLVVGEEAVAANTAVLDVLDSERPVWVVDPLDGTRNFAHHRKPFGVMVALVKSGETIAGWIYDPLEDSLLSAERNAGSWLDERQLRLSESDKGTEDLRGAVMTGYLPEALRAHVKSRLDRIADWKSFRCAAHDYRRLVTGEVDFLLFYRTLVWDHAPGVLIAEEAGATVARYEGEAYSPRGDATGLICANTANNWELAKRALLS